AGPGAPSPSNKVFASADGTVRKVLLEAMVLDVQSPDGNGAKRRNSDGGGVESLGLLLRSGVITDAGVHWFTNILTTTETNLTSRPSAAFCCVAGLEKDLDSLSTALVASDRRVHFVQRPRILTLDR